MIKALVAALLLCPGIVISQDLLNKDIPGRECYIYWGYHRNFYAPSDIHFKSERYDFTLHDVKANDMPAEWRQYFNLNSFSVPQFNFRMGTAIKNNWFVSLGYDHHKYRLTRVQQVKISGNIDALSSEYYAPRGEETDMYIGSFDKDTLLYNGAFMDYHHSNGMNFIRAAIEKRGTLASFPKLKSRLDWYGGFSTGAVLCWTDFTFLRQRYLNNLRFSGVGISAVYGLRWVFNDRLFIQHGFQNGINFLFDIQLEKYEQSGSEPSDRGAKARQNIHFFERGVQVGYIFRLGN